MSGARRRRSTSVGEGDLMNNTLDLPEPASTNRFNEFNSERCVSTPQINTTGFIDDTYRSNRGTRFEPRRRTRSRGGFDAIDKRLRDDFIRLRNEIFEWGQRSSISAQSMDVINEQYGVFLADIEHRIKETMFSRGDFNLVAEYGTLKDKLNTIRRVAKGLSEAHARPDPFDLDQEINIYPRPPLMTRSFNHDPVFQDNTKAVENSVTSTPKIRPEMRIMEVNSERSRRGESGIVCGPGSRRMETGPTSLSTYGNHHERENDNRRVNEVEISQTLSEMLDRIPGLDNNPRIDADDFTGGTESWMRGVKSRQHAVEEKVDGLMKLVQKLQDRDYLLKGIQEDLDALKSNTNNVWERLKTDEQRLDGFETNMIKIQAMIEDNMEKVQGWCVEITTRTSNSEIPEDIINSLKDVIHNSSPGIAVEGMRAEIEEIRDSVDQNRYTTDGLRSVMANLSDQVINVSMNASNPSSPQKPRDDQETSRREREIVRKGIERMEKQLKQIVLNDLALIGSDISLIKKHKTVDVPAVHAAVGNMQKSLQKYVKFSGMDHEYCESIDELLDSAENWCLKVEELYNKAEVHSINTSKGDASDVGVFSDNAKVTVYEFLESAEIAYLGWGNSVQKANRLFNHHLSEEIKGKLINMSDSYTEMKSWLITNYGGASRIVSDILRDLNRKPKPSNNNSGAMFSFYAYVSGALQRLERLTKVNGIDKVELETNLFSRATLTSLSLVLPNQAHADWITEMTKAGLDYKNPVGDNAYKIFKNLCIIERNKSEGSRDLEKPNNDSKPRSPRSPRANKVRSVHKIAEENKNDEERDGTVFATSFHNTKWYQAGLKFPCPIRNHQHEISTCADFFAFNPVERWSKMDKGKICYTCISPKDQCSSKRC